jgi:hypothetical protein
MRSAPAMNCELPVDRFPPGGDGVPNLAPGLGSVRPLVWEVWFDPPQPSATSTATAANVFTAGPVGNQPSTEDVRAFSSHAMHRTTYSRPSSDVKDIFAMFPFHGSPATRSTSGARSMRPGGGARTAELRTPPQASRSQCHGKRLYVLPAWRL